MTRIYLDHAATTPLLPAARQAMIDASVEFGNPSSLHEEGRRARQLVDEAREVISRSLGADFAEVLFTGSGTESAVLALAGISLEASRKRVLMCAAEHHCVLETAPLLRRLGIQVDLIRVDRQGRLDLDHLGALMGDDVLLVACMHANNELGTIQPIHEVVRISHERGALVFCDAVQTYLSLDWNVDDLGVDLVSISAHKVGGPKGVGALYVRAGTPMKPLIAGGGQEREMRAGTENVMGIAGFAAAVAAPPVDRRTNALYEHLKRGGFVPSVTTAGRLAGIVHGRFPGVNAESMLILLDRMGVSASSGAACSSGSIEPSHVLLACGYSETEASEGLRFSVGKSQTDAELNEAAQRILEAANRLLH